VGIRGILLKFRSSVLCFASHCRGRTLPTINHYSSFGGLKLAILIVGDFNNSEIDGRNSFRLTIRRSTSNSVCIAIRAYRSCMWQFKKKNKKQKLQYEESVKFRNCVLKTNESAVRMYIRRIFLNLKKSTEIC
jgi:hypothetical protein